MATYAPTTIAGTTGVFEYTIGFSYARVDDVKAYIDGVEITRGSAATQWVYSASGTKIKFTTPNEPQTGETLVIRRLTDVSDAAVTYTAGSGFVHPDINKVLLQLLYSVDELQVPAYDTGFLSVDTLVVGAVDIEYLHNLGAAPTRIELQLKCTSAELGYATSDIVNAGLTAQGFCAPVSTTAFTASFTAATALTVVHATTGVPTAITDSSWSYRIMAWR